MSQTRRQIRELKRRNIKHDPALQKLVMETVLYIENSKNWKKSQKILEENEERWYKYAAGTTAAKGAFMYHVIRFIV